MRILKPKFYSKAKCIYQSEHQIYVYERKPYRWVLFNQNYIQTMIDMRKPERPILPYLYPFAVFCQLRPGNMLLLGLGGGGLIHYLKPILATHTLTVVEKYQNMINIAKNYFDIPSHPHLEIICADAKSYLTQRQITYPYILIDLGDKDGFPIDCSHRDFFQNAFENLDDEGTLILNLTHHHQIQMYKEILYAIFQTPLLLISANGNWLLVATKNKEGKAELIELLQHHYYIKNYQWIAYLGDCLQLHSPALQKIRKWIFRSFAVARKGNIRL